ncbi:hypothetical protein [Jeotgalibacillus sp. R-1-5s-1]|uniref:hypothetical protein n=1 Tax=Jeotgalibacillus sp. R-1-5s-1 TaxID=2555897 RepID=UPI00106C02AA|nr:hypothetical protein [Jeotgalibacillus sp. R-1-5s-1]TFE00167.1 hypothetical protein E2491_06950 [Jeotgalibacillus sp. R-1-5s-1]
MKKILVPLSFITIIALSFFLFALFDLEIGKFDHFEEAIEKGIPYTVNDVVHVEQHNDVSIVMYTTTADPSVFPNIDTDVTGIAYFTGNDDEGWESVGSNGWTHYNNDAMTVYIEPFRLRDDAGDMLENFYVSYGEIHDANITAVQTKSHDDSTFREAKIIEKNGLRYYIQTGEDKIVQGVNSTGEVISRQGG